MTEPREPEGFPEGESAPPERPVPETGNWHPVEPKPEEPTEPLVVPEPPVVPEPDEGPSDAPTEPLVEPVETSDTVSTSSTSEAADEGPSDLPTEPVVEPVETQDAVPTGSTSDVAEEEPSDAEATTPISRPAAEEPTSVFAEPTVVAETERLTIPEEPTGSGAGSEAPAEAIFRPASPSSSPSPEPTRVEPISEEEQKLAAERAARRDARAAALAAPPPQPVVAPEPVVIHKRTNDKFWGSLGLFLLRIVLAGIFAVRGLNILTDVPAAQAEFAKTILADIQPGPQLWAIITGVASLLIALALLLGLLTRVAGLGIALIAGGALALVYWGPWSPFVAGQAGFLGEYQLLLATVGVLLLFIGGGGWSLDRSFRSGRERNKQERVAADE